MKNKITLGLKILNRLGEKDFLIFLKLVDAELSEFSDHISLHEYDYLKECWESRRYLKDLCDL